MVQRLVQGTLDQDGYDVQVSNCTRKHQGCDFELGKVEVEDVEILLLHDVHV